MILTCMIVVRIGSLCVRLAYVYESYTYDSPTGMNHTGTQIVRIDFLRARQSYKYDTKAHTFTSPSGVHANHGLVCARQSYAKDSP